MDDIDCMDTQIEIRIGGRLVGTIPAYRAQWIFDFVNEGRELVWPRPDRFEVHVEVDKDPITGERYKRHTPRTGYPKWLKPPYNDLVAAYGGPLIFRKRITNQDDMRPFLHQDGEER